PNNGEGFAKNVGGKQLPNAPHFTASLTANYSMPLSQNWVGTFHTDFYWQSQSWARVFNDANYDKIHGYSNLNLALIFNDATGTQVMAYVKNVFDTTAITGDFLNSDDTGLTTNIFLTSPRLYGIRITKKFGEGGWNSGGGLDFIPSFFTDADGKAPHVWLTLGGDYNEFVSASESPYNPLASANFPNGGSPTPSWAKGLPTPAQLQHTPTSGFDWNGALSFRPPESDWVFRAAVRYGRSSRNVGFHKSQAAGTKTQAFGQKCTAFPTNSSGYNLQQDCEHGVDKEFDTSKNSSSEQHAILDFTVGKEVGIGLFGTHQKGTLAGGVRIAQFDSRSHLNLGADPVYNLDPNIFKKYHEVYQFTSNESRSFRGMGPEITWNAHTPLAGNVDEGEVTLDWGMNFAVLFGRQRVNLQHTVVHCRHSGPDFGLSTCDGKSFGEPVTGEITEPTDNVVRSHKVGVPNLGGHIGASMVYRNAKISVGYRYDGFFGVMDGGETTPLQYNRSFAGPYVNFTLGLGG
ncbi:MAG: TonB-dependent receptor, partial [Alphaproteobacteria bacterium]|nr:TonB-dependent receptor [Alphaproteobacteria bacterium]